MTNTIHAPLAPHHSTARYGFSGGSTIDEEAMLKKGKGNLPFDINKPPLKAIPHQHFPKMLYLWPKDKTLHPTSKTAIANNADEEAKLVKKGYRLQPHIQEHPEEAPDGFEADVPAEVEAAKDDEGGSGSDKPIETMTKAELVAHAKEVHGIELDPSLKKEQILAAVQQAGVKPS